LLPGTWSGKLKEILYAPQGQGCVTHVTAQKESEREKRELLSEGNGREDPE